MKSEQTSPGQRPTLRDVAARAGVSRALVSIVMRGAPGASAASRERVLHVAAEMNYRPDARARSMASKSSPLIGVVYRQFGLFHQELLDGLYAAADAAGYDLILSAMTAHRDEKRASETLLDFRCDVIILLGPEGGTPVLAGRLPVVVVGWHVPVRTVDVVRCSDDQGAQQAVDHLTQLGHRTITYVDGGPGPVSGARWQAYRAAMHRRGLPDGLDHQAGGLNQEHGVAAAYELMESAMLPTAVVAYNDEVAAGLIQTFRHAGLRVPQDISVVGWDDSSLARLPHIDLTTVRQDQTELARIAVQRGVARLAAAYDASRDVVLPTELILRSSTGPPDRPHSLPRRP